MDRLTEKTIHSKKIFEGKLIRVQVDEVSLPNGELPPERL